MRIKKESSKCVGPTTTAYNINSNAEVYTYSFVTKITVDLIQRPGESG